ncbi:glycosyltransferase family 2 protein [Ekhidna sp.]|uniref:glycosyltransferase family 2 protein n=1 Tax=Ekhidna sp. TaxID=2608089 RepID=UPI003B5030FF
MDNSLSEQREHVLRCCTIIVTYNGAKWINKCLETLFQSSYPTEIIVIDNGSTDQTIPLLEKFGEKIQLIKTGENLGFGGANNIGMKMALNQGFDFFFLLNQDTWVEEDAIEALIVESKRNTDFGILSPIHMNGQMTAFDKNFKKFVRRYKVVDVPFNEETISKHETLVEVGFINAAAWLITKKCIQGVGVFSPLFYHYAEDNNYCHRTLSKGFKIGIVKESIIYHDREYRNDAYSPTKDFERETVKSLSNPLKNRSLIHDFLIAIAKILEISTKIRFYKIPGFSYWAVKEFFKLRKRVHDFDESALYNFELETKYS